jgi:manganese/zinc/iron transport system permease protein
VLVSAMLIMPAATASLLTDRFHRVLVWSSCIGMLSGLTGAFLSFLGTRLPTGPFMVLSASLLFASALLFSPRQGIVPRWYRQRSQRVRIARENTLKAIYQVLEAGGFTAETVSVESLAARRRVTPVAAATEVRSLVSAEFATLAGDRVALTPSGWQRACAIVRNHRLWELYLTHAAQIAPDHVHDDAEKIEHVLGEATVRDLERRLPRIDTDPHGRTIPAVPSAMAAPTTTRGADGLPRGYGGRS